MQSLGPAHKARTKKQLLTIFSHRHLQDLLIAASQSFFYGVIDLKHFYVGWRWLWNALAGQLRRYCLHLLCAHFMPVILGPPLPCIVGARAMTGQGIWFVSNGNAFTISWCEQSLLCVVSHELDIWCSLPLNWHEESSDLLACYFYY